MNSVNPQLKLPDLVLGLERFGERYAAIDIFADDLLEARSMEPVAGLYNVGDGKFWYLYGGKTYALDVFPEAGVIRLSRTEVAPSQTAATPAILAGIAGGALGAAMTKKGAGAAAGLILGLLAGAALSNTPQAPRRVFTLRFDTGIGQWRPYDGGLVPWMKENLLPGTA